MAQSHNCAFLDRDNREECHSDEPCQYCLTLRPFHDRDFCGKDQLTGNIRENDPRIATLTERVDAATREIADARLRVCAARKAIRENIGLLDALATLQTEIQHERGNRADMAQEYRGKIDELHRALERVGTEYSKKNIQCDNLSNENAAMRALLKVVL